MSTKIVAVGELEPGYILADNVLSVAGHVLLSKDMVLTPRHISLLTTWDIKSVFIALREEIAPLEKPLPTPRKLKSEEYYRFVREYDTVVTTVSQSFDFIRQRKMVPLPHLRDTAGNIHSTITVNSGSIFDYLLLSDFKLADYISRHSVMVAFLAGTIARQMKWNEEDVRDLTLAGLLHDVGSLTAGKSGESRDTVHLVESAALLKQVNGLTNNLILGVLQHRELEDGSGFPTGAQGLRIHPFAKVISIADLFHCKAYFENYANPLPVLDLLANDMLGKVDPVICKAFIDRARDSLLHNRVMLSSGHEAEIIFFHPNASRHPVVKTRDDRIIDLSKHTGLTISRMVSIH